MNRLNMNIKIMNKRASRLATMSNAQPTYTGQITIDFDEMFG